MYIFFNFRVTFHFDGTFMVLFLSGEKEYYEKQFATLKSFEEVDSLESNNAIDEDQYCLEQVQHERAMNISNCANFLLLAFKVFYFSFSGLCKLNAEFRICFNIIACF